MRERGGAGTRGSVKRGDIYFVVGGAAIGSEQSANRPAVVVSNDIGNRFAPIVEVGIEEGLCGLYCKYEGILAPSYETSCRDGCWMCHNQGVNQLRQLRKDYPELWALLLKWDLDSPVNFKPDGHTVHDYDRRFQLEDDHFLTPGDTKFRWNMLDGDLQKSLF